MNFEKYTTQELEFITSNAELFKKVLQNRRMKELDKFPFKVGDVIHTGDDSGDYFIRINEIDKRNNKVSIDEIEIRCDTSFDVDVDECFSIDNIDWVRYTKVENPDVFENLLKVINKYYNDVRQLHDDTYQKIENELGYYE